MQLWKPEFELDGINSGSWYHCLLSVVIPLTSVHSIKSGKLQPIYHQWYCQVMPMPLIAASAVTIPAMWRKSRMIAAVVSVIAAAACFHMRLLRPAAVRHGSSGHWWHHQGIPPVPSTAMQATIMIIVSNQKLQITIKHRWCDSITKQQGDHPLGCTNFRNISSHTATNRHYIMWPNDM